MKDCIFCKIGKGEIPSKTVYEDENMLIFHDISPQAKIHYLMIPKTHYENVAEFAANDPVAFSKCFQTLSGLLDELGLRGGYRIVTNQGKDARQSVFHVHFHIMGGESLSERMG